MARAMLHKSRERVMSMDTDRKEQRTSTARLHPFVWAGLIGLVIWFALAIWGFGTEGYADWLLSVVSGLDKAEFEIWQDHLQGVNAAAEIAIPIAAAAVGMTAFAIVFHYAAAHA